MFFDSDSFQVSATTIDASRNSTRDACLQALRASDLSAHSHLMNPSVTTLLDLVQKSGNICQLRDEKDSYLIIKDSSTPSGFSQKGLYDYGSTANEAGQFTCDTSEGEFNLEPDTLICWK